MVALGRDRRRWRIDRAVAAIRAAQVQEVRRDDLLLRALLADGRDRLLGLVPDDAEVVLRQEGGDHAGFARAAGRDRADWLLRS